MIPDEGFDYETVDKRIDSTTARNAGTAKVFAVLALGVVQLRRSNRHAVLILTVAYPALSAVTVCFEVDSERQLTISSIAGSICAKWSAKVHLSAPGPLLLLVLARVKLRLQIPRPARCAVLRPRGQLYRRAVELIVRIERTTNSGDTRWTQALALSAPLGRGADQR